MQRDDMLIEAAELLQIYDDPRLRVFDASFVPEPYRQAHLPGAAYFDHARFSDPESPFDCTILPLERLAEQIGRSGIANESDVIVYAAGMLPYAARAWWVLRYAGHSRVRVLNGGLAAWTAAGGTVEQTPRVYAPAVFQAAPRPEMFVGKEAVLAALPEPDTAVVNVLPPQSYAAAHITGSSNLSCMDLMQGMDYFLPADQLAARLQATAPYRRVITYCGGGIAAALNAMAHVMVGQPNAAVYDGSLYEWTAEGLPMTGQGDWEIWKAKR